MKKELFYSLVGVMKFLGLIGLIGLYLGITMMPHEELEFRRATLTNPSVITAAIHAMFEVEGKIPSSLSELCSGPYMAIRCEDLKNPYTGKPIAESLDTPGDVHFIRSDDTLKYLYHNVDFRTGKVRSMAFDFKIILEGKRKYREEQIKQGIIDAGMRVARMDDRHKSAYAVGRYLKGVIAIFEATPPLFTLPRTFQEILDKSRIREVGKMNYARDVEHLRNEFTKGYARFTETPSPGDFYFGPWKENPSKYLYLATYGEGGKVIFDALYDLTEEIQKPDLPKGFPK